MKTLRTSRKAKVTAFILCVLCLTLALGCRGPLEWLNERNAMQNGRPSVSNLNVNVPFVRSSTTKPE